MSAEVAALTALLGLLSSFIGSFLCFVIWVHFSFDERWEERKYNNHVKALQEHEHRVRMMPREFDRPRSDW